MNVTVIQKKKRLIKSIALLLCFSYIPLSLSFYMLPKQDQKQEEKIVVKEQEKREEEAPNLGGKQAKRILVIGMKIIFSKVKDSIL